MGERTILTALIDTQIPDYSRQKDNRRFHKEVALFGNPTAVKVEHYRVAGFVSVRYVRHEAGVYRVASVAFVWVIKVDNVKLRFHLVAIQVVKQMIVSYFRQIRELVIITVERKTFLDLLFYVIVYHCV